MEQAAAIGRSGLAEVMPLAVGDWEVRTGSKIGVTFGDDWELRVVPKLKVPRLMFLLGYALDQTGWRNLSTNFADADDVIVALATGFAVQTTAALDRGVLRGYVSREEALRLVRGRIRFGEQIGRAGGLPLPIHVAYDDFTDDIYENKMLLTAAELLLRLPSIPLHARRLLLRARVLLDQVEPFRDWRGLKTPTITRLNERYGSSLRLAGLILSSTSISADVGGVRSTTFVFDMNKVFENFVTAAFRSAMRRHGGVVTDQDKEHSLDVDEKLWLKPDLVWRSGGVARAVLDAKYKAIDAGVMRNGDAYQMLAYCTAYGLSRGYLVYAKDSGEEARVHRIRNSGHEIEVVTLDVEKEPKDLLADVEALAERVAWHSVGSAPLAACAPGVRAAIG